MQKFLIKLLSQIWPSLVVKLAYQKLTHPQVRKLRENEMVVLDRAEKEKMKFRGFDIQLYRWPGGPEKVLLVHGWEGQAGNFSDLIEKLLQENYTVIAFDGPSHGFSSQGPTSLFEFSELVAGLIEKYGISKLVSHSFGGVATTYALYNHPLLEIDKYALLTTPDRFRDRINFVSDQTGITNEVKEKLIQKVEAESGVKVENMNVSSFVREIKVKDALIIHDKEDKVISISQSRNVSDNWDNCRMVEVEGTGHFRILRTEDVLQQVVEFL